jgi:hypothetical protein
MQILNRFVAQEFAADFVVSARLFLKQHDLAAGIGQTNGNH